MNFRMIAFGAAIASACFAQPTLAQQGRTGSAYRQAGYSTSHFDEVAASPSDAAPAATSGCSCNQPDGSINCDTGSCDDGADRKSVV